MKGSIVTAYEIVNAEDLMLPTIEEAKIELEIAEKLNPGPWIEHSLNVGIAARNIAKKVPGMDANKAYIVGMLHDVCKLDDYIDENASDVVVMGSGSPISKDPKWTYNPAPMFAGHGDKSVMMLSQVMTLTEEEMLCIRFHMGAYVTSEWDAFDRAIRKYQSVLFTHTADMYASKVKDV